MFLMLRLLLFAYFFLFFFCGNLLSAKGVKFHEICRLVLCFFHVLSTLWTGWNHLVDNLGAHNNIVKCEKEKGTLTWFSTYFGVEGDLSTVVDIYLVNLVNLQNDRDPQRCFYVQFCTTFEYKQTMSLYAKWGSWSLLWMVSSFNRWILCPLKE